MKTVVVARADGVVTVTLNRPERKNAINGVMWDELRQTFDDVAARPEDRVVVLTGAGGAVVSGPDLSSPAPGAAERPAGVGGRPGDSGGRATEAGVGEGDGRGGAICADAGAAPPRKSSVSRERR